jgi:AcrR family transcriptional regulator
VASLVGMSADVASIAAPSPAWERRRRLIRRDIEECGLELMAQHGYEGVSTDELSAAAGISPRTFFRYFPSKDDLVMAMPLRVATAMCEAVGARPRDESLLDSWRAVAAAGASWDAVDVRSALLFRQVLVRSPSLSMRFAGHPLMLAPFIAVTAERLGVSAANDLRPVVFATAVQGAMHASLQRWAGEDTDQLGERFVAALDLLAELPTAMPSRRRKRAP